MKQLIIFTDGSSRGNPGPGYAMYVINSLKKRVKLNHCTNNEAEYKAVIYALQELVNSPKLWQGYDQIVFKIDSNLVVQQLNGIFKVKNANISQYVMEINGLLAQLAIQVHFQYIPREQNLADKLKYWQNLADMIKMC